METLNKLIADRRQPHYLVRYPFFSCRTFFDSVVSTKDNDHDDVKTLQQRGVKRNGRITFAHMNIFPWRLINRTVALVYRGSLLGSVGSDQRSRCAWFAVCGLGACSANGVHEAELNLRLTRPTAGTVKRKLPPSGTTTFYPCQLEMHYNDKRTRDIPPNDFRFYLAGILCILCTLSLNKGLSVPRHISSISSPMLEYR